MDPVSLYVESGSDPLIVTDWKRHGRVTVCPPLCQSLTLQRLHHSKSSTYLVFTLALQAHTRRSHEVVNMALAYGGKQCARSNEQCSTSIDFACSTLVGVARALSFAFAESPRSLC